MKKRTVMANFRVECVWVHLANRVVGRALKARHGDGLHAAQHFHQLHASKRQTNN